MLTGEVRLYSEYRVAVGANINAGIYYEVFQIANTANHTRNKIVLIKLRVF